VESDGTQGGASLRSSVRMPPSGSRRGAAATR
jgi:hypothetical protein